MEKPKQIPAQRTRIDIISNAFNEHLRPLRVLLRISEDNKIAKAEKKSEEIAKKATEVRELVSIGMNSIRSLIQTDLKDPASLIDLGLKENNYLGMHSYVSHKVYLTDTISGNRLEQVVNHELSHYVRHQMKKRKFHSFRHQRVIAKYHLVQAAEEGTAEFIGAYLTREMSGTATLMAELSRLRDIHEIKKFYEALSEEAKNPGKKMEHLDKYLKEKRKKNEWYLRLSPSGLRTRRSNIYTENYNTGVMLATILLAANGFNQHETALEMLTHSNEDLLKHIFTAISKDGGSLSDSIEKIDIISQNYSERMKMYKRRAEVEKAREIAVLVGLKRTY